VLVVKKAGIQGGPKSIKSSRAAMEEGLKTWPVSDEGKGEIIHN